MSEQNFTLGVNYWPAETGIDWWRQFDETVVERDFNAIVDAGFDAVRIFLRWEDFQPNRAGIDTQKLIQMRTTLDIAERAGLKVVPSLFATTISAGVAFWPEWTKGGRDLPAGLTLYAGGEKQSRYLRDIWRDTAVTSAQNRFIEDITGHLGDHNALLAWDLAHHIGHSWQPLGLSKEGHDWAAALVKTARSFVDDATIWYGSSLDELRNETTLRVSDMATAAGTAAISIIEPDGRAHPPRFVEFVIRLTTALADQVPVVHAVGASTDQGSASISEEEHAEWAEQVLLTARGLGVPAVFFWTWTDYDRSLWNRPSFSTVPAARTMGVVRADGTPKPALDAIQRAATVEVAVSLPEERINPDWYYSKVPFEDLFHRFYETGQLADPDEESDGSAATGADTSSQSSGTRLSDDIPVLD